MRRTIVGVLLVGNVALLVATSPRDAGMAHRDCLKEFIRLEVEAFEGADRTTTGSPASDTGEAPFDTGAEPQAVGVVGFEFRPETVRRADAWAHVDVIQTISAPCPFGVYFGGAEAALDAFPVAPAGIVEAPEGWTLAETGELPAEPEPSGGRSRVRIELPVEIVLEPTCNDAVRVAVIACEGAKVEGDVRASDCYGACELHGSQLEAL